MPDKTSFWDALREKYCDDDDNEGASDPSGFVSITVFGNKSRRARPRELVGAGAAEDGGGEGGGKPTPPELAHLKHVVLENRGISHAAIPSTGLSSLCPNVLELDLSFNALTSWTEVLDILRQLPLLRFVNLSSNPLQDLKTDNNEVLPCSIRDLVLNNTKVTWPEVAALSRLLPRLEQLHLCKNDYSEISLPAEVLSTSLPSVRILTLNNNYIKRWEEVSKLRLLPNLRTLVLLENPLEDVFYKQANPSSSPQAGNQTASRPDQEGPGASLLAEPPEVASSPTEEAELREYTVGDVQVPAPPGPSQGSSRQPEGPEGTNDPGEGDDEKEAVGSTPPVTEAPSDIELSQEKTQASSDNRTDPSECLRNQGGDSAVLDDVRVTADCTNAEPASDETLTESCAPDIPETNLAGDASSSPSAKISRMDGELAAPEPVQETEPGFQALQSLCLTSTALSDWKHLQELSGFPVLTSVKLKNIPLLQKWEEKERRKVAVACLPQVKILNGSEVTPTERDKAERHFVRLFHGQADTPARHNELVQKHGELEPLVQVDLCLGFQEFARLSFVYRGRCVQQEVMRMTAPIGTLRKHCAKLVDQDPSSIKLYLKTRDPDTQELAMEELFLDSLPMSRFDIREGSEIHIDVDENAQNFWWKSAVKMAP